MRLHRAFRLALLLVFAGCCSLASARFIQPDPEGQFPMPSVPKPITEPVANTVPSPMLSRVRVITASDVLMMQRPNHLYVYVDDNPLSYIDPDGTQITGFTRHGINQVISRNISPASIMDAMRSPLDVSVRIGPSGASARYTGSACVVVINPAGDVITAWPR